jgi:hypothetical protein
MSQRELELRFDLPFPRFEMKPFARFAPTSASPREAAPDFDEADVAAARAGDVTRSTVWSRVTNAAFTRFVYG